MSTKSTPSVVTTPITGKRRPSMLAEAQATTPTPAKKTRSHSLVFGLSAQLGDAAMEEARSDDEDDAEAARKGDLEYVTVCGKKFGHSAYPQYNEDSIVAFLTFGAELGGKQGDIEKEMRFQSGLKLDFTAKPSWICWSIDPAAKSSTYCGKWLPQYIHIDNSCHACMTQAGSWSWIRSGLNPEWWNLA